MKKLLLASILFALASTATGYAHEASVGDTFEQFQAKIHAARLGPASELPLGANVNGSASQTPEQLQAMMEQEAADQEAKLLQAGWNNVLQMQAARDEQRREEEALFSGKVIADSKITAVTVYNDKATVTRIAEIDLPAGNNTLVFKELPRGVFPNSVHVEGKGPDGVKFGSIAVKDTTPSRDVDAHEKELFTKIESLRDQLALVFAEETALQSKVEFLSKFQDVAVRHGDDKTIQPEMKPAQWVEAAQSIYAGIGDALKSVEAQQEKERGLRREMDALEQELNHIEFFAHPSSGLATGNGHNHAVMVPFAAEKPVHVSVTLTYQTDGATWYPLYDARLSITSGKLSLDQFGVVRQQTGEDWNNVSLTLSTAQPQRDSALPDLSTRWIDGAPNPPPGASQGMSAGGAGGSNDALAEWRAKTEAKRVKMEQEQVPEGKEAEQPEVVPMVTPIHPQPVMRLGPVPFRPAEINTSGFVAEYKMPDGSTVPSDNSEVKLKVGAFDLDSTLEVRIEPQVSTNAVFVVEATLKGDASILPGQASLYRDNAYVGQASLPLLRPGQEHDLFFGVDDQVSVRHSVVKDEKKEAGIISKDNLIERGSVTALENLHDAPMNIVVKQAIPASRNEKVRVDLEKDITTSGYTTDADNVKGLLNWQLKMDPKEKKDLKLDWTVSWPSDYSVTGL